VGIVGESAYESGAAVSVDVRAEGVNRAYC
jgi:hypothetical protein